MDDSQAINAILQGDKNRYEELVGRYRRMVYAIAWSHLGDTDLSEDAAQETFVKAYCYLGALREPGKFSPWLARIARNVCNSFRRRAKREDAFKRRWAVLEAAEPQGPEESREPLEEQMWSSFAQLPEIHREALTVFYIEGKSTEDMATVLGITESTARVRLSRARVALREQLAQKLEDTLDDLQPSERFTHSVMLLLPLSPKGAALGAGGGALAVFGKLFASLSFVLWISVASVLAALGLSVMFSKLDEASLEDTPENQPIKAFIRRGYMIPVAAAMFAVFMVRPMWLLMRHFELSTLFQIVSIPCAYMTWRVFKLLRVNTSTAVIGGALANAVAFIAIVAIAFFQASSLLLFIAMLLVSIIAYFTTQKTPQGFGFNLFTGSALGIFGDFEDDQSLGRRLTRTEMLSFAKFLGGLWLVQDYKWRADGITLLLPAIRINIGGLPPSIEAGSRVTITWDGAGTATMSAKDLKVTRQLLVGRSVEAAELQDNACRVVRYVLSCFLRGDLEAARKVLSPYETPSAQSLTTARHNRVKSLVMVFLTSVILVMLLLAPSAKEKELHHWVGAYYALIVGAAGFLVAMLAMVITLLRATRRRTARSDGEDGDRRE